MNTTAIIFSKNRTLQLKSLLLSMRHYSDTAEENINVIYKEEDGVSYEMLIKEFKCKFIRQGNFLEDISKIINTTKSDYIWFMVDDLIYRDDFSLGKIENYLDSHKDVEAFCLRLGKNITVKGKQPDFIRDYDDVLVWDSAEWQGKYWNYFWELCSSIYRRELVLEYLSKCRSQKESFPNPFEFHYYACMPTTRTRGLLKLYITLLFPFRKKSQRVACFKNSKCFTHGVNLVAELDDKDRPETYSYKDLHQKMLDGWIIDFISPIDIKSPNPGGQLFKMVKEKK
jgi:hypothetical protein